MDVKFHIEADCRVDNIDKRASEDEIAEELEEVFEDYIGIKAIFKVSRLKYIEGEQDESKTD